MHMCIKDNMQHTRHMSGGTYVNFKVRFKYIEIREEKKKKKQNVKSKK